MTPEEKEALRMKAIKLYVIGFTALFEITEQAIIDQIATFLPVCEQASDALAFFSNYVTEEDLAIYTNAVNAAMEFFGVEYQQAYPDG